MTIALLVVTIAACLYILVIVTGRTRAEDFALLREVGFTTPKVGALRDFGPYDLVVAYIDEHAHRGDGKELGLAKDLIVKLGPDMLASEYIKTKPVKTWRALAIGHEPVAHLEYTQLGDDWRSNVGEVEIKPLHLATKAEWRDSLRQLQEKLVEPLIAVDFIGDLAIDLNTAPGLRGTPLTETREQRESVAKAISKRYIELIGRKK